MKVRVSIKKMCSDCRLTRRRAKRRIICSNPKHNQCQK